MGVDLRPSDSSVSHILRDCSHATMGDMEKAVCMADHFDKIQKLPDPIPGCPNFRRVPGFKVYCSGQPTIEGFEKALEKVCGTIYPKDGPIIWFNLRQEPTVYVNGNPICARPANKIGEYAELGAITRDIIKAQETAFLGECEGRKSTNGGKLKIVDVNKKESEVEVKELKSLSQAIEGLKEKFPGLIHWRVPVCNSASPLETDYDIICKTLVGTSINTPIIVNDQVGLSRATTGCVIASLFKEFQISASFEGLVETVPGVNASLLKTDRCVMDASKDALFRGEFEVVKQLVSTLNDGAGAKNNADKIIDLNGTKKTGGTGIKQLRENIAESKIMDNIHKYFYLIVFAGYMREAAVAAREVIEAEKKAAVALPASGKCSIPAKDLKVPRTFADYMDENAWMREHIETGKGNLQWERDIPPAALSNLEGLAAKDFKGNLGQIIHDIYQTAHLMFNDMPQGDHKKRAKYRFASKTLMRILPDAQRTEVEGLIEKGAMTLDLYEILGTCTWVAPK